MRLRRPLAVLIVLLLLAVSGSGLALAHGASPASDDRAAQLAPLVGTWQSDTTQGISARSSCTWTPTRQAVACEQVVTLPSGPQRGFSLYLPAAAGPDFVFYGIPNPGARIEPTRLTIAGSTWTYGGASAAPDGRWYRTINEFPGGDRYTWRAESSTDGVTWTTTMQGANRRVAR
jgi:hypothetical protein